MPRDAQRYVALGGATYPALGESANLKREDQNDRRDTDAGVAAVTKKLDAWVDERFGGDRDAARAALSRTVDEIRPNGPKIAQPDPNRTKVVRSNKRKSPRNQ